MRRPPIRTLDLAGSHEAMGIAHGREHAAEIRHYARERVDLVASGMWSGGALDRSDVLVIADTMLAAHETFDRGLYEELIGVATGAGISPAEAIVVGGFTDFVDTVRAVVGGPVPTSVIEDDCTAVLVPDERAAHGGFLAQTWDMHDSATPHVLLLRLMPDDGPAAVVFTTTGCLGQIGLNEAGVAVGINNLVGTDGARAVTWTTVVRAMLQTNSADDALRVVLDADLAGAHNYLILDRSGVGYNVEAMPSVRHVERLEQGPLAHTNHTTVPDTSVVEADKDDELFESSHRRLDRARSILDSGEIDEHRLMALTRDDEAICQRSSSPFHIESSGAAIMRPATSDFWACWGLPSHNDFIHISMPGR